MNAPQARSGQQSQGGQAQGPGPSGFSPEDVWTRSTNGITANIAGRRCNITRAPANIPGGRSVMRASIEGFSQQQLPDDGIVASFQEGKQVVRDVLIAGGLLQQQSRSQGRYAPHPVEVRLRSIEAATSLMASLRMQPVVDTKDLEIRVQQMKILAGTIEAYALEAGAGATTVRPL